MPCLIGCLALLVPRIVLAVLFLFTNYLDHIWVHRFWPVLGFLLMPLTTLAYAFAKHKSPGGSIDGGYLALIVVAAVIDLGMHSGGGWRARTYRWRREN